MRGWARQAGWQVRFSKGGSVGRWWPAICIVPLLALVAGCCCFGGRTRQERMAPEKPDIATGANVFVASMPSPVRVVAVMPFQAETELIGRATSDLFVTEILRAGRYELVERGQLSRVLNEAEVALSGISESEAVALGNMLGADGVIIGTVDEYGAIAQRGRNYPVVGLSVRLIDCESGRVMWSTSFASMAEEPDTPLSQHCRRVVRGTVMALRGQWHRQPQRTRSERGGTAADAPVRRGRSAATPEPAPGTPPAVPSVTVDDFGLRAVKLRWTDPNVPGLTYRIERALAPDGPFMEADTVRAARGAYTDHGTPRAPLNDATTYYYRVTAISRSGLQSKPGPVRESMTAPPPVAPTRLEAVAPAGRAVALRWAPSEDEAVTRYTVERAAPPDYEFLPVGESEPPRWQEGGTPDSPLDAATMYRYRVRAENRVGAVSDPSDPVEVTTQPPPVAVEGLTATSQQPRQVPIAWQESPESDVVRYEIERSESADGPFTAIAAVEDRARTAYVDEGDETGRGRRASLTPLQDAKRYFYRVRPVNAVEVAGPWSATVDAETKPVPVAPPGLQASVGKAQKITISWEANPEPDIAAYDVAVATDRDGLFRTLQRVDVAAASASLTYSETGLAPGLTRYYRLRAVDADDLEGEWSAPVAGTTKPLPDAPREVAYEWVEGNVHLAWQPPPQADVVRYRVQETRMLRGHNELQVAEEPSATLTADDVGRRLRVVVTAIDVDELESEPSEVVDVRPPE